MAIFRMRAMITSQQLRDGARNNGLFIANAVFFQITWFACVIGGAAGAPQWGFAGVLALLVCSWFSGQFRRDLSLLALLGVTGFFLDTAWIALGILDFGEGALAPSWIVALWLGFSLTVNHSLGWLRQRPLLAGVLTATAAPITYLAGARLGAVEILDPWGLLLLAGTWGLMFMLLFASIAVPQQTETAR